MNPRKKAPSGSLSYSTDSPLWCRICALVLASILPFTTATGATQVWIPGSVDWDTDPASLNWDTPPSDGIGEPWTNGNNALFDFGTGIVIVGAPGVEASSITMLSPTTIAGAPLTLVGPARIDVSPGITGTFDSQIAGSGGLQVGTSLPGSVILRAETSTRQLRPSRGMHGLGLNQIMPLAPPPKAPP